LGNLLRLAQDLLDRNALPHDVAFQAIKLGAHFVATNPDRTCPVEGGEIPDCTGMIAAIEAVTTKKSAGGYTYEGCPEWKPIVQGLRPASRH
jgi:ribonucleotide monophosphatase NagD (HAD superfamily)